MKKEIFKLNGVASAIENLIGIHLVFVPVSEDAALPACSQKKSCVSKNFSQQCKQCGDLEMAALTKAQTPNFTVCQFPCGLVSLLLPVYYDGALQGAITSSKIKGEKVRSRSTPSAAIPRLDLRQVASITTLLNVCRTRFTDEIMSCYEPALHKKKTSVIARVKDIIEKQYHNPKLSLKALARDTGVNHFYLSRLFKSELKITLIQYLTLVRLRNAARLLQNPNLTIAQVAYAAGYSDPQYFDRIFKKVFALTPKQYRSFSPEKQGRVLLDKLVLIS